MLAEAILPWHAQAWEVLSVCIESRRIPQALLITGASGIGKQQLALNFAQTLVCEAPRRDNGMHCGCCSRCRLFQAGTHPDVLQVTPEEDGKAIGVDQIRALIAKLMLKPQFDGRRVTIIHPAEQMNRAAANAFLKCLEEPTERTSIILLSAKPYLLPATIASRCQKLNIGKPDRETALLWLTEREQRRDWSALLDLAGGAPLQALGYAERNLLELRNACFDAWLRVAVQTMQPSAVAENWYNLNTAEVLSWLVSWTADLIKSRSHPPASRLINADLAPSLEKAAQPLDLKALFGFYDLLLHSKRLMPTTVNKQLLFEEILINWQCLNSIQRHGRTNVETGHFVAVDQR